MVWVEVLGWVGSALLIVSLLQTRLLRLRVLNTIAAVVLVAFNWLIGVWPMTVMNLAIVVINLVQIARLRSANHAEGYDLLGPANGDCLMDGQHVNDLGFRRMAVEFAPVLKEALAP